MARNLEGPLIKRGKQKNQQQLKYEYYITTRQQQQQQQQQFYSSICAPIYSRSYFVLSLFSSELTAEQL